MHSCSDTFCSDQLLPQLKIPIIFIYIKSRGTINATDSFLVFFFKHVQDPLGMALYL